MVKFGIIAEGPTDQTVIENILLGFLADQEDEPAITHIQPPRPLAETPGGWGHVFKCLERKDHEGALQFNDYLVIHIDTDVQEEPGFDVPRREGGKELSVSERVDRVIARLKQHIEPEFYQTNAHRILFAIAVDTIECWLLPLVHNDKKKAKKITGCLESANQALRKANQKALSAGESKFIHAYESASSDYRRRKTLIQLRDKNPSLELFIKQLDILESGSSATNPGGTWLAPQITISVVPAPVAEHPSSASRRHRRVMKSQKRMTRPGQVRCWLGPAGNQLLDVRQSRPIVSLQENTLAADGNHQAQVQTQ